MKKDYRTICFVGSDKNAGKTTALNFVYHQFKKQIPNHSIILLSIGINGEDRDALEGHIKPKITVKKNDYFITEQSHLNKLSGKYEIKQIFGPPEFKSIFVLSKALFDMPVILQGPNEKKELIEIKDSLKSLFNEFIILLDGSIDRQFIASGEISDEFYFSLLISNRTEQLKKVHHLLRPLNYPSLTDSLRKFIKNNRDEFTKSLVFNNKEEVIYKSNTISFLDDNLSSLLQKKSHEPLFFYLDGALTNNLLRLFAPFKNLTLILDNFTQDFLSSTEEFKNHSLKKFLFNPVHLSGVFLKEDSERRPPLELPSTIPIYNLFRDEALNEIRI